MRKIRKERIKNGAELRPSVRTAAVKKGNICIMHNFSFILLCIMLKSKKFDISYCILPIFLNLIFYIPPVFVIFQPTMNPFDPKTH